MNALLRPLFVVFIVLTLITGVAYPVAVAGLARGLFPAEAAGSLVSQGGRVVGSALIGQSFSDPKNFWGRPSAPSCSRSCKGWPCRQDRVPPARIWRAWSTPA